MQFDLASVQQDKDFQRLDQKVQTMITNIAQAPKSFEELKIFMQEESKSIKYLIDDKIQQHQRNLAHDSYRKRFLKSLWFPEIHHRQERIRDAFEKTFQWIYGSQDPNKCERSWDNFVEWLESGQGVYWINGKAGSGKSTLMNYICQDARTINSLKAWSGMKEILTPSFFFWDMGTEMEKSIEGLLRSLVYQVLDRFSVLTPGTGIVASFDNEQTEYGPIAAWTERRLLATFKSVMLEAQKVACICLFIDGLDEFSGDQEALIALIAEVQTDDVKLCLSSRPHRLYTNAFGVSSQLRLQDLTKSDIRIYVSQKLQRLAQEKSVMDVSELFDDVVEKAEGVFLWVELVVKDLMNGLRNDDGLKQLEDRLRLMPSDMEGLYAHILSNIDRVYKLEVAKLFRLVIEGLTGSLLNVVLAMDQAFDPTTAKSMQTAASLCKTAINRIPAVSAGLLEVELWEKDFSSKEMMLGGGALSLPLGCSQSSERAELSYYEELARVAFLHRTAAEFLQNSQQGQHLLNHQSSDSSPNPRAEYVKALLTKLVLLGFPEFRDDLRVCDRRPDATETIGSDVYGVEEAFGCRFVEEVMNNVALAERKTGVAQVSLCGEVDRVVSSVYQRCGFPVLKTSWYTRWGLCPRSLSPLLAKPPESRSRSVSVASFHSAKSGVATHRDLGIVETLPVDFLGLAASWGLNLYVKEMIDLQKDCPNRETLSYLICCSMWSLLYHKYFNTEWHEEEIIARRAYAVDLTAELLRLGGNPNTYIEEFSNTAWGVFLLHVPKSSNDLPKSCAMTARAFLENGADVHKRIWRHVDLPRPLESLKHHVGGDFEDSEEVCCCEEMTPGALFRRYLSWLPQFEGIKAVCLARGGHLLSSFPHIALKEKHGRCLYRPYGHAAFDGKWHGYEISERNKGYMKWGYEEKEYERDMQKVAQHYKQLFENGGEVPDSCGSPDEENIYRSDIEEEFYELSAGD